VGKFADPPSSVAGWQGAGPGIRAQKLVQVATGAECIFPFPFCVSAICHRRSMRPV
jgi:hypothetical protein